MSMVEEDRWWDAVVRRDRRAIGDFVYAVKTTGIYCRPSCGSRLPNRENVGFFAIPEQAERAGFRACRRCKPDRNSGRSPVQEAVILACSMIEEDPESPSLEQLAKGVGLSPHHFQRAFKGAVGVTPKGYATSVRTRRLREALGREGTVTGAIYAAGYGSSGRCYEESARTLGMTPSEFKEGAMGLEIRHAIARCRLGWVLVAATRRGLCLVEFDDSPEALRDRVAARFPGAEIRGEDPEFAGWVEALLSRIETPGPDPELPLDIQGTAFQRRVWEVLRSISPGSTATYSDVADRIGSPKSVRAVARACASNELALVVPCHRVVRKGGDLSGYRWGVERKRELLDREADCTDRTIEEP
ncbi:bifunctional DNA-binding transcriptional regulator/O6-methylguanine-DNA methyltransferase Ada [Tundrisphaera lichenicola]|uniref:bifunctional DNA-binding transcriptional regulator/O6-methylguanine-DNA methyltransferase Ada n=1 Tax=Tundrisphaera lichenicola TaxID=2029860 RepID=UPI003EB81B00